jgi:hypothetical protein
MNMVICLSIHKKRAGNFFRICPYFSLFLCARTLSINISSQLPLHVNVSHINLSGLLLLSLRYFTITGYYNSTVQN